MRRRPPSWVDPTYFLSNRTIPPPHLTSTYPELASTSPPADFIFRLNKPPPGEGAHGVVVRARHNATQRPVALKKIPLRRLDQASGIGQKMKIKIKMIMIIAFYMSILNPIENFEHIEHILTNLVPTSPHSGKSNRFVENFRNGKPYQAHHSNM